MRGKVQYSELYRYLLPDALPPSVRYVLVEGGRGSAKSYHTSTALVAHTDKDGFNILFSRFTMVAADISIIPEFQDKIELSGHQSQFDVTKQDIINKRTGAQIFFRGIMQGSRNQTARLKSIPKLKMWVNDESEELTNENTFNTIDFSLRSIGAHSQIWLVLNPADITHWIYRRFHASAGVPELPDDTCTIVGDTAYIHTTYLSNYHNLDPSFIAQAEKMRDLNPDKYNNIFLGHWNIRKEGLIYKGWEEIAPQDYPVSLPQWYGLDWGYASDPTAVIRACYDPAQGILYLWQVLYLNGVLVPDIAGAIVRDAERIGYTASDCIVYCDPARPDNRDQLRTGWSINAVSAINKDKTGRIGYLQGFRVRYVGKDIAREVGAYSWMPNPYDESTFTDKPQDGNDHALDAVSYLTTHLRRLGIANALGEH